MNTDGILIEARARIIWGETPSAVHQFLTSNGMSPGDADRKIQEFCVERSKEIRKAGIRNTCIGAAIICGCGSFIAFALKHPSTRFPTREARLIYFSVVLALFGLWKLLNGLVYLLRPKSETRSITELSD